RIDRNIRKVKDFSFPRFIGGKFCNYMQLGSLEKRVLVTGLTLTLFFYFSDS
ncbi:hypothetical protein L9F63_024254, partial [Diploptera punctata]